MGSVAAARAQQPVGNVERIAVERGVLVGATSLDEGEINRPAGRQAIITQDPLFTRDIVRLYKDIAVHMRFSEGSNRSQVFIRPGATSAAGAYEIREDAIDPLSSFQVILRLGTMVVERESGRFVAFLLGKRVEVPGSTVLFNVSEADSVGLVYLRRGHIRFPECDIDERGEDLAWDWDLSRQPCPTPKVMGRPQIRRWQRDLRYATETVWRRPVPFYRRPEFLIPVGAAVVGVAVVLLTGGDANGETSGSVIIPLPD